MVYNSVHFGVRHSTPFLPGISHLLHGRLPRSQRDQIRLQIKRLRRQSLHRLCEVFGAWLPMDLFKPAPNGTNSRERVFSTSLTFWAYLSQILDPGCACREVVRKVQTWHARRLQPMPRSGTGAYCQARKRLPLETLLGAHRKLADRLTAPTADSGTWKGHRVRVVDGTGVSMPDTPQNRKGYSQPSEQKPGCGFPVMGIVGCFVCIPGHCCAGFKGSSRSTNAACSCH